MIQVYSAWTEEEFAKAHAMLTLCQDEHRFELGRPEALHVRPVNFETLCELYRPPGATMLILRFNLRSAGCAGLVGLGPERMELHRFYVRKEFRRRGIGRRLMEYAIRSAKESGHRELFAALGRSMPEAWRLLLRHGFVEPGGPRAVDDARQRHLVLNLDRDSE